MFSLTENISDAKVNQMLNVFVQYFKVHSPKTSILLFIHSLNTYQHARAYEACTETLTHVTKQ